MSNDEWSSFHDDLVRPVERRAEESRQRAFREGPSARTAGIEWDGASGEIRSGALETAPGTWDDLLRQWDLDPAEVEIVGPVRRSSWEVAGHGTLNSYRARIQKKNTARDFDFEQLAERISKRKPSKREAPTGEASFVACYGDTQFGKEGTEATIDRYLASLVSIPLRLRELRRAGRSLGPVFLPWLGDCIEHTVGSYASQSSTTELTLTEQIRVLRRLAWKAVEVLAPLTTSLKVPVVPGNHDKAVRQGSEQSSHSSDSFANDMASYLYDLVQVNPEVYGHVEIIVPERNSLVITQDMSGTLVVMAHGHQFPGGADGITKWWMGQAHGCQPAGEATLLLCGHKHHLDMKQLGKKTYIQVPALDSGSQWYVDLRGQESPSGLVTLTVGPEGWDDFKIL